MSAALTPAATTSAPALRAVMQIAVNVAPPLALGELGGAERRLVAILGGSVAHVDGVSFSGTILPGGSDLQLVRADGAIELLARYAADLGKLLIDNAGIRRQGAGGADAAPYFRGTMRFTAPAGPLQWLNDSIFVSTGYRDGGTIHLDVFEVL